MKGQFNRAIVYTDQIDEEAIRQITELCNQKLSWESPTFLILTCTRTHDMLNTWEVPPVKPAYGCL